MAADVAQREHSNINCYASAFSIIQIPTTQVVNKHFPTYDWFYEQSFRAL